MHNLQEETEVISTCCMAALSGWALQLKETMFFGYMTGIMSIWCVMILWMTTVQAMMTTVTEKYIVIPMCRLVVIAMAYPATWFWMLQKNGSTLLTEQKEISSG